MGEYSYGLEVGEGSEVTGRKSGRGISFEL